MRDAYYVVSGVFILMACAQLYMSFRIMKNTEKK